MTRNPAAQRLLDLARAGKTPTPVEVVADLLTIEELDAFRQGLSEQGRLTSDMMRAIRDRMDAIHRRDGSV